MLAAQNYRFSSEAEQAFNEYIRLRMTLEHFANARSVRNALDRARLRQANRLFAGGKKNLSRIDLMTLEADDIRASRVFLEGDEGTNDLVR
ncbi:MAG: AAA ATPase [Halothiobacillaceae bacterium]|nr:MAG: AAA ATPase [Halothiobacillaceae bacterium]